MDCIQGTLEKGMKMAQQGLLDDLWTLSDQGCVSGEEFLVDDLLDFSNGFAEEEINEQEGKNGCALPPKQQKQQEPNTENHSNPSRTLSAMDDLGFTPCGELSIPADEMDNLEWLSHFVEDSFSGYPLTYPAGKLPGKEKENRKEPDITVQSKPCLSIPIQTKVRTKRPRTGWRVWSFEPPSLAESSTTSSSSSSSFSSSSSSSSSSLPDPWVKHSSPGQTVAQMPQQKKRKRKSAATESPGGCGGTQPRKCSHCGVHKTPQWRAGPLGAKTLCNACGVRFKSGRLLPEYRPACSPTFSSKLHSNNHRKVLEMRRQKELELEAALSPPVRSF